MPHRVSGAELQGEKRPKRAALPNVRAVALLATMKGPCESRMAETAAH